MIHLPADFFTKPILRALGIPIPIDPPELIDVTSFESERVEHRPTGRIDHTCRAICGVEAPRESYRELVHGPPCHPDVCRADPNLELWPLVTVVRDAEETIGSFRQETPLERFNDSATIEDLLTSAPLRWFLTLPNDGRSIVEQLGRVNCEACHVALDRFSGSA